MDEFELIATYFRGISAPAPGVALGIGDDAAVLDLARDEQLIVSTDTHVEGVHFPAAADAETVGYRACATSLSDIAAMGASPRWASLALTMPRADPAWLGKFARGTKAALEVCKTGLVGGDTTIGPLTISWTVFGTIPTGAALKREGATLHDGIYVSGTLGSACGAVQLDLLEPGSDSAAERHLRERYWYPQPRVALGQSLRNIASSCIDVSDGLLADLSHIAKASGCGAVVELTKVPIDGALLDSVPLERAREMACNGGDDYELCFTVPPERESALLEMIATTEHQVSRIGHIESGTGVRAVNEHGEYVEYPQLGYRHFV